MKSFKNFIQEEVDLPNRKFVKVPTNLLGQNNDITDSIFNMIDKTYKNIGGYPDFKKPSDLPDNHTDWFAADVDKDPDADITTFGKTKAGNFKLTGAASDGSEPAKAFLVNKLGKLLKTSGNYAEASDALAHVMITRKKVPYVADTESIQKLLYAAGVEEASASPRTKRSLLEEPTVILQRQAERETLLCKMPQGRTHSQRMPPWSISHADYHESAAGI